MRILQTALALVLSAVGLLVAADDPAHKFGVQEVDPKWQAQVPKDPEPPAANAPAAPRGENWAASPGYDRAALDAVQKYPWKS